MRSVWGCAVAAMITLGACAPQSAPPDVSPAEVSALQAKWQGKWAGTWESGCTGAITVDEISGSTTRVLYEWGACDGGSPGDARRTATIEGDQLRVNLFGQDEAVYTLVDANTLDGFWSDPSDGATDRGTFRRE
ncbi:MAG: hypothetical protein AAF317_01980 [Pseudomonadota bacterium]